MRGPFTIPHLLVSFRTAQADSTGGKMMEISEIRKLGEIDEEFAQVCPA